jgi:hypothetical protein
MTTIKRSALLLFAGLFAAATLQTAGAQGNSGNSGNPGSPGTPDDNHEVTINVNNIDEINVTGSPSITIDTLSTDVWTSGNGDGQISEITSNAPTSRKITVQVLTGNSDSPQNLGLRVSGTANNLGNSGSNSSSGSFANGGDPIDLLEVGDSSFENGGNGTNFYTGFQSVHNGTIDLTYEAQANASYDPGNTTNIEVQYTLTSDN